MALLHFDHRQPDHRILILWLWWNTLTAQNRAGRCWWWCITLKNRCFLFVCLFGFCLFLVYLVVSLFGHFSYIKRTKIIHLLRFTFSLPCSQSNEQAKAILTLILFTLINFVHNFNIFKGTIIELHFRPRAQGYPLIVQCCICLLTFFPYDTYVTFKISMIRSSCFLKI